MRETKAKNCVGDNHEVLAVDIVGLMNVLGCGRSVAEKIGTEAHARINTGTRKNLYCLEKIRDYLYQSSN